MRRNKRLAAPNGNDLTEEDFERRKDKDRPIVAWGMNRAMPPLIDPRVETEALGKRYKQAPYDECGQQRNEVDKLAILTPR
jgi:hypothetical protein